MYTYIHEVNQLINYQYMSIIIYYTLNDEDDKN